MQGERPWPRFIPAAPFAAFKQGDTVQHHRVNAVLLGGLLPKCTRKARLSLSGPASGLSQLARIDLLHPGCLLVHPTEMQQHGEE
ncbi:MAG: hypothetical protein WC364_15345 [Eubacteriales bacterium]